jgi:malonate transporter
MTTLTSAIAPILILILIGFFLRRAHFLSDDAWAGLEKLTYFILFPALLVRELANQRLTGVPWPPILLVVLGTLLTAAIVLVLWHRVRKSASGPVFTSIFQGGVRFNTYIALAVAQAVYGAEGLALAAVAAGFMIVVINVLCISAFAVWGEGRDRGARPIIREVAGNPLIISCALGWFLSISQVGLPGISKDVVDIAARAALPLGLLAVGGALRPEAVRGHLGPIVVSSIVQFGIKPLIAALLISLTGVTGVAAGALLIAMMTPTAPSAVILSRQLGGDTETMASIITIQTGMAFLLLPILSTQLPR